MQFVHNGSSQARISKQTPSVVRHTIYPQQRCANLDMLEMKELNRPHTGGVGKAVDLRIELKVNKPTLKTRSFQEACIFTVVEELTEHLAQWSYSVAFFELSFVPTVRLRN
ncbi:hypothetical protein RJ639_034097 [Escallonia herrerae]|uniref:Uncharacterized protein n=1 Tax=Escallonia herrerae TaxID=1293975 RepID=A0AA88WUD0_9ASTE|nr:hypothetical protein RJ639_034097 [Escallonia herrerae]